MTLPSKKRTDDPARHARPTIKMTPMIDVTFQLIVVFLCSMKFRTLDMKIETDLPDDAGIRSTLQAPDLRPRAEIRLRRSSPGAPVRLSALGTALGTDADGEAPWRRLDEALAGVRSRAGAAGMIVEIVADPEVPHGCVVRAMDGAAGADAGEIRFRGTRIGP